MALHEMATLVFIKENLHQTSGWKSPIFHMFEQCVFPEPTCNIKNSQKGARIVVLD